MILFYFILSRSAICNFEICFYSFYRAITKILGDWWANLNASEKSSYTNLAKDVSILTDEFFWSFNFLCLFFLKNSCY